MAERDHIDHETGTENGEAMHTDASTPTRPRRHDRRRTPPAARRRARTRSRCSSGWPRWRWRCSPSSASCPTSAGSTPAGCSPTDTPTCRTDACTRRDARRHHHRRPAPSPGGAARTRSRCSWGWRRWRWRCSPSSATCPTSAGSTPLAARGRGGRGRSGAAGRQPPQPFGGTARRADQRGRFWGAPALTERTRRWVGLTYPTPRSLASAPAGPATPTRSCPAACSSRPAPPG